MQNPSVSENPNALDRRGRLLVLVSVFLGWMFAGMEMSLIIPMTRPAIQDFLSTAALGPEALKESSDRWFSYFLVAFFLGAALGGAVFGWVGDRFGRVKAMGGSILCYSVITGLGYFVTGPEQLLALRFVACMGIGGMWPNGVALLSEAWPAASRPFLSGMIGTSANVGFLILGLAMIFQPVTRDAWRWMLLLGTTPVLLAVFVFAAVPESPRWLVGRAKKTDEKTSSPVRVIFQSPYLHLTLLGIALGTIPLLGGWASGQRLIPWAGRVGEEKGLENLKAYTQIAWALGAVIGSLGGGWFASRVGLKLSYFLISLGSLLLSFLIFFGLEPSDPTFLAATFALGVVSIAYFGWLPYFLPTLFPTRIRATGAGVSFNFGRIVSAAAVLSTAALTGVFRGDIPKMAGTLSLVYVVGMVVVWFIPRGGAEHADLVSEQTDS